MSTQGPIVAAGVVVSLVVAPAAMVWPRAWAYVVTPQRLRWRIGRRPWVWAAAVAVPLMVLAGASMSVWMLGGPVHPAPAVAGAGAARLTWLVFGGSTAIAFARALIRGAGEWQLTDGRSTTPKRWDQPRSRQPRPTGRSADRSGRGLPDLLETWGFVVVAPAGDWVRSQTPGVFFPVGAVAPTGRWPWAARGVVDGRPVVLAEHRGPVGADTLASPGPSRVACTVRVPNGRLPLLVLCAPEAVPVAERHRSVELELPGGRTLSAYGADPAGLPAALHPLLLSMLGPDFPDGAGLRFAGDQITVFSDSPVSATQLTDAVRLLGELAEQVPAALVR